MSRVPVCNDFRELRRAAGYDKPTATTPLNQKRSGGLAAQRPPVTKILLLGALAALFFSSTFILNRAMSLEGGHWYWSASLRYLWMLGILLGFLVLSGKARLIRPAMALFARHALFWTISGGVGFGVFYALLCYSASYAPGWVIAATWQTTILATPLTLLLFGRKVPLKALTLTGLVFAGVFLVNLEQAGTEPLVHILLGAAPVLAAAFAYPLGNQMLWEARQGGGRFIPDISDPVLADPLCRALMLTLGSLPFWAALYVLVAPPAPSGGQVAMTVLVALFSGALATPLFLSARNLAADAAELAAADCTQSLEVVFSLAGECLLLGGALPGPTGIAGVCLTMLGLALYLRAQTAR